MREQLILQDAIDEGRKERDVEKIEDMLRRGKTVEQIVEFCNYPLEQVRKIEQNMLAPAK